MDLSQYCQKTIVNGSMSSVKSVFTRREFCHDGDTSTWCSTNDEQGAWLQLDFNTSLLSHVRIYNRDTVQNQARCSAPRRVSLRSADAYCVGLAYCVNLA